MTLMLLYFNEKQAHLMKRDRCLSCKKGDHITYNCPRNKKIVAI